MTNAEVISIEKALQIALPAFYKDFILHYPAELKGVRTSYAQYIVEDYFLYNDAEKVINDNIEVAGRLDPSRSFPKDKFIIGENGSGNYYLLNLNSDDPTVYYWDHEDTDVNAETGQVDWDKSISEVHKDLQEYKQWLIEFFKIKG